jgi:hypothetical protein
MKRPLASHRSLLLSPLCCYQDKVLGAVLTDRAVHLHRFTFKQQGVRRIDFVLVTTLSTLKHYGVCPSSQPEMVTKMSSCRPRSAGSLDAVNVTVAVRDSEAASPPSFLVLGL